MDANLINFGGVQPNGQFDTGAQPVNSTSIWQPIGRIQLLGKEVLLRGIVGAGGNLSALRIAQAAVLEGDTDDLLAAYADYAAATLAVPLIIPALPENSGSSIFRSASGTFQIHLRTGAAEIAIYAKGTGTTLQITGSARHH